VIFDEVISGFRLSFGGYAGRENLKPDLITYGKIIGGGLPVGAIAGSAAIMDNLAPQGPVYQAGTLSGNPLAMAAGLAALRCLAERDGAAYAHLKKLAERLKAGFESEILPLLKGREWTIQLVQEESLFWFSFRPQGDNNPVRRVDRIAPFSAGIYKQIFHAMLSRGVYLAPSAYEVGFLNVAMRGRDIDYFIECLRKTVRQLSGSVKDFP
jgi:glutamate-1-semialdehyde 2,1-aminomutase